jgi:hypothetical protein
VICFQDRTFCAGNGCARFEGCPRALTEDVKVKAVKWWGSNEAPISQFSEPEKLECFQPSKVNEHNRHTL